MNVPEDTDRSGQRFLRSKRFISQHPIFIVATLFVCGAIIVFWYVYALQVHFMESAALRNASLYTQALTEFRSLYSTEVVKTVRQQGIEVTHDYKTKPGAIPLPATMSMDLGKAIGAHQSGAKTRLYSPYPFPWRKQTGGLQDAFDREAWQTLSRDPEKPFYRFENYNGRLSIRYATADIMLSSCVNCHNTHPQTPKNDWRVGDVRGILEIIHPLDEFSTEIKAGMRGTFILLAWVTVGGVVLLLIVTKSLRSRTLEAAQSAEKTAAANQLLNEEIIARQHIEDELLCAREDLEGRVTRRTTDLALVNENLQSQLKNVEEAQDKIAETMQNLEWKNWEFRVRTEELEHSNQELQDFTYIASHDLQEPLRKVQAFGTRLEKCCGSALSEQGRDYLGRMQNAASRMQGLIDDLLRYSRVTTMGKEFVAVNLNEIVAGVLSDLEVAIAESGGRVAVSPLPTVQADPVQMRQLFQNLIGNALKYHSDKAPHVTVTARAGDGVEMSTAAPGQMIQEIVIEDNGIGFDEKHAERIFGMFQRLHGRSEYKGTGVGLAICRKIILRHEGQITAHGRPGEGATFTVSLPMNDKEGIRDE